MMSFFEASYAYLQAAVAPIAPPILVAALVYAVVNRKVLPFAWHTRIIYGYIRHYHLIRRQPLPPPPSDCPTPTLFQHTIYTTTVPLGEIDYSLHKSNSTYLTDLDVARGHHLYTVFRPGFTAYAEGKHPGGKKAMLMPALGGVTCSFRREIRPYAPVEIWTRVLAWDDKWIFLVSHFVRPEKRSAKPVGEGQGEGEVSPDVYATCVSKYVLKQGRKTVLPEEFLRVCGFLGGPALGETVAGSSSGVDSRRGQGQDRARADAPKGGDIEVERRRVRGLELASHLAALDEGHKLFGRGSEAIVLAKF